ncbi:protein translocase subunit SecF [Rubricoccus marinus]|uniref:Protein-export membrane protein SecF n=1 Tax=Rubricoccus marinus TaxID=716817 RepID=A0A259TYU8_9BACT|nr:protein translocase subunit SecF [Rubricoccus marinus]OZC02758.1 protein-export membrane protein SecF [Rubricoccus marinus]
MRIFESVQYDFWGKRRLGLIISSTLIVIALISLVYPGLEAGIDFKGGTEVVVETQTAIPPTEARAALNSVLGEGTEVKQYGDATELLIRTSTDTGDASEITNSIQTTLASSFAGSQPNIIRTDAVGPRFAEDLQRGAMLAVFGSLFVILLYIFIRFDWRFALGAVAALAHDVIIVLGLFALVHDLTPVTLMIDQTIIAALLTIVGYSINDTVVVFDRVREFANLFKTEPFESVANRAISSTLSRTFLTSFTTILVVFVLFIFGGEVLRGFSLSLIIGILVGTYSSVFVATPLVVLLRERFGAGVPKLASAR